MMNLLTYAAPCVRARAFLARRLRDADWQQLLALREPEDIIGWLQEHGRVSPSADRVEMAEKELREGSIRAVEKVVRFTHGSLRRTVSFFIHYFDLLNVETVVRHLQAAPAGTDLLPRLYRTGPFGLREPEQLASATSLAMLADALRRTPLFALFNRALIRYEKDGDLGEFLDAMEIDFLREWTAAVKRHVPWATGGRLDAFSAFLTVRAIAGAMRRRHSRPDPLAEGERRWLDLLPEAPGQPSAGTKNPAAPEEPIATWRRLTDRALPARLKAAAVSDGFHLDTMEAALDRVLWNVVQEGRKSAAFNADSLIGFGFFGMIESETIISLLECRALELGHDEAAVYLVGVA